MVVPLVSLQTNPHKKKKKKRGPDVPREQSRQSAEVWQRRARAKAPCHPGLRLCLGASSIWWWSGGLVAWVEGGVSSLGDHFVLVF